MKLKKVPPLITEMKSLLAEIRGRSKGGFPDKFSFECVALFQALLDLIKPDDVFPRSVLNSPLLPGLLLFFYYPFIYIYFWIYVHSNFFPPFSHSLRYTPSEHFQQVHGKGWGDEAFIESQKFGDERTLGEDLDGLPIEIVWKIFRFVGMKNMFRRACVSKYWYFVISSVFYKELQEAVTDQTQRQRDSNRFVIIIIIVIVIIVVLLLNYQSLSLSLLFLLLLTLS